MNYRVGNLDNEKLHKWRSLWRTDATISVPTSVLGSGLNKAISGRR